MRGGIAILLSLYTLAAVGTFLGCAGSPFMSLRDMAASKEDYKRCLRQNPDKMQRCDALRAVYEADLRAYRAIKAAPGGGTIVVEDTQE